MADLKKLDKNFAYDLMKVPSLSGMEHRMVTYIMMFAHKNNIDYQFDNYGNLYLTKGKLEEGEYYPCMTAHVDTVQRAHTDYIIGGDTLTIKTVEKDEKTELHGDGYGLGGDDKCGVLIALSCFKYVEKMKASFFLEEESGCLGSQKLDKEWFQDVGYVIGFDSPDFNRSAWSVSGTQLFNKDFYLNHMKEVCDKHGRTKFYSEPFTDLKHIRTHIPIQCMNFGSGYYNGHMPTEYVVLEEVDDCIELALDLINHLKNIRYELQANISSYSYGNEWDYDKATGKWKRIEPKTDSSNKEDLDFLKSLGDSAKWSGSSYGNNYRNRFLGDEEDDWYDDYYAESRRYGSHKNKTKVQKEDKDNVVTDEYVIMYVMNQYDKRIKQIEDDVKAKCKELNIDFETEMKSIFDDEVTF